MQSNLERLNLPYPEAVFEISYFAENPLPCRSSVRLTWIWLSKSRLPNSLHPRARALPGPLPSNSDPHLREAPRGPPPPRHMLHAEHRHARAPGGRPRGAHCRGARLVRRPALHRVQAGLRRRADEGGRGEGRDRQVRRVWGARQARHRLLWGSGACLMLYLPSPQLGSD